MCREVVRCSRNKCIATIDVFQCNFCVNFSRFYMAALQNNSCRLITGPSFPRPTPLCFGCFSSTGKRYPEMDMDRTVKQRFSALLKRLRFPASIIDPGGLFHFRTIRIGNTNARQQARAQTRHIRGPQRKLQPTRTTAYSLSVAFILPF